MAAQDTSDGPTAVRPTHIYLVALGEFAHVPLEELAAFYRNRFGLAVDVLPPIAVGGAQVSLLRRQVVAEELVGLMRSAYPDVAESPDSIVFGLTEFDMYAVGAPAPYLFDWRQDGRFVVVSSSHMDPGNYLRPVDREVMRSRVQKMITRNVGIVMFGLQLNGDALSVLSANIATLDDLDRVGTDLPL